MSAAVSSVRLRGNDACSSALAPELVCNQTRPVLRLGNVAQRLDLGFVQPLVLRALLVGVEEPRCELPQFETERCPRKSDQRSLLPVEGVRTGLLSVVQHRRGLEIFVARQNSIGKRDSDRLVEDRRQRDVVAYHAYDRPAVLSQQVCLLRIDLVDRDHAVHLELHSLVPAAELGQAPAQRCASVD